MRIGQKSILKVFDASLLTLLNSKNVKGDTPYNVREIP